MAESSAPDFTAQDLSGNEVVLSSFKGKSPVLLAFGATWCPYCRREVPNLIALRKNFRDQDLAVLAVDVQEGREKVAAFAAAKGINYTVLLDTDGKASDRYGVTGIPFFVLVSRDGNIAATDYSVSRRLIDKIRSLIATN